MPSCPSCFASCFAWMRGRRWAVRARRATDRPHEPAPAASTQGGTATALPDPPGLDAPSGPAKSDGPRRPSRLDLDSALKAAADPVDPGIKSPAWVPAWPYPLSPESPRKEPPHGPPRSTLFYETTLPWHDASAVFSHHPPHRDGVRVPKRDLNGLYAFVVLRIPQESAPEMQILMFRPILGSESMHAAIPLAAGLHRTSQHYAIRCGGTVLFNQGELARWSLKSGGYARKDPTLALDTLGWPAPELTAFPALPLPRETYMPLTTARQLEVANANGESVAQMLSALSLPETGAAAPAPAWAPAPAGACRPASPGSALTSPTAEASPAPFDPAAVLTPTSTGSPPGARGCAPSPF